MTLLKFDYDGNGMPIAEVDVKNKDKLITLYFFVDSGADFTLIPRTAAEYLGLLDGLKEEHAETGILINTVSCFSAFIACEGVVEYLVIF